MNSMSYKGYHATVGFDAADDVFNGRIEGITDVVGFHADTVAALKTAFHEAVDDYLDTCAQIGKQPMKAFSGKMMFRVDPSVHAQAALAATLSGKSLNTWAEEAIAVAARKGVMA